MEDVCREKKARLDPEGSRYPAHSGADAIEVATILGWHIVVKKGEFRVGNPVVYVEIDSVLPERRVRVPSAPWISDPDRPAPRADLPGDRVSGRDPRCGLRAVPAVIEEGADARRCSV
jgi:hypothetical protein